MLYNTLQAIRAYFRIASDTISKAVLALLANVVGYLYVFIMLIGRSFLKKLKGLVSRFLEASPQTAQGLQRLWSSTNGFLAKGKAFLIQYYPKIQYVCFLKVS